MPVVTTDDELEDLQWLRDACSRGLARVIRTQARLSLSEAGAPSGIGPSTVYRWETGQRVPHGERAISYARTLRRLLANGRSAA